jgi:5-methylcytosine-specific restriction endonuclease McrA
MEPSRPTVCAIMSPRRAAHLERYPDTRGPDVTERADILASVCQLLDRGEGAQASALLEREYPFSRVLAVTRTCSPAQALQVFRRDGFIDRYSGTRLVFPGVLRILSSEMRAQFPYHPNWKASDTHFAYWELYPTVDHVVPVTRGGLDEPDNWMTTSMLRNSAKGNWTLAELGWRVHPAGNRAHWDGLESWFTAYVERKPELTQDSGIRTWCMAAINRAG